MQSLCDAAAAVFGCRARSKRSISFSRASTVARSTHPTRSNTDPAESQVRNNRRLQATMRSSRLPAVKQLRDLDFTLQPSLRREQIESLHELGFVERAGDRHFLGPPGVGQDAPGDQLGNRRGRQSGGRVYYGTLAELDHVPRRGTGRPIAGAPQGAHPLGAPRRRRGRLSPDRSDRRHALLPAHDTPLRARVRRASPSNKGFEEWGDIFGDEVRADHYVVRSSRTTLSGPDAAAV